MTAVIEIRPDAASLERVRAALDSEMDGEALKRDLQRKLREAAGPAMQAARDDLMSMHAGLPHPGESLRRTVAGHIRVSASLAQNGAGVSIRVPPGGPRGFVNAPRKLASSSGWRHPVYGNRNNWVSQIGKPDWFGRPIRAHAEDFKNKVVGALEEMIRRLAARMG